MLLTESTLRELSAARGAGRMSIYLPTHRRGPQTAQDPIRLKNLLVQAHDFALELGASEKDVQETLAPATKLIGDALFWRHQGDGLAVFLAGGELQYFRLSAPVDEFVYVGDRFCVRPLLTSMTHGNRFYILALSQNSVRLFDCSRADAREVDLYDVPANLKDAVGYDWEQRSLQFHTGTPPSADGKRAAMFHGQGRQSDQSKQELEEYFRGIDRSVSRMLDSTDKPVVLACVQYLGPIFRRVNKHLKLHDETIVGNPDAKSPDELHAAALGVLAPYLDAQEHELRSKIGESSHPERRRVGITEVLPTLREGRVAGIILANDGAVWGTFDESSGHVEIHETRESGDDELLDLAVSYAFATGAEVYGVKADAIPDKDAAVAALLRF